MYGGFPWYSTQHDPPAEPPSYSAEQMAKRGDGAASARESVRAIWEAKLGKRLVWTLGEDQVWRLTDAPELATGRVVVTRKG